MEIPDNWWDDPDAMDAVERHNEEMTDAARRDRQNLHSGTFTEWLGDMEP